MIVVHHPDQALHDPEFVFRMGQFLPQPDRAERYRIFLREARKHASQVGEAPLGGMEPVLAVHDEGYVAFLETVWQRWRAPPTAGPEVIPSVHPTPRMHRRPKDLLGELGWYSNSTSCPIGEGTYAAALASAASAVHAADLLLAGGGPVYALCRPPGHHAGHAFYGGYCFLNNAAVAAQSLRDGGAARVAVLDVDYHHGNGTQEIFWERGDVLFVSIHADPLDEFPYFCGHADETGTGAGEGANLNLTLPWGTDWAGYAQALAAAADRIREFGADALVLSLGADTYGGDPISRFRLLSEDFLRMGAAIAGIGLPTLFVMEGGYAVDDLGVNVANVLTGFARA